MRISVLPGDPGYTQHALGTRVFLDGAEIDGVFTADDEKRLVVVAVRDERGAVLTDGDGIRSETRFGHVRVELAPSASS